MGLKSRLFFVGLGILGVTSLFEIGMIFGGIDIQNRAQNFARKVGYKNPKEAVNIYYRDLNNDGLNDLVLKLKDGREVKYINNGYTLVE